MNIRAPYPFEGVVDFDKRFRKNLASLRPELAGLRGFKWLWLRLKIHVSAWRKTDRETRRYHDKL
jgi:hypothetical protein